MKVCLRSWYDWLTIFWFDHVGRNPNRLRRVDQRPLDGLLDPVAGVGAEACIHVRIETFDGPQQTEVAFFDQILQRQTFAGVGRGRC